MNQLILSHLPGDIPWQVQWFDTIDSTNNKLKELAVQGAPHGTVVAAGHQTGGRGRMGRSFHSPEGMGLYLSVLLRPDCAASELMHLTCGTAVSTCNAVEKTAGIRPGIKWINDLVVGNKKLGGILTELSVYPDGGNVAYAVIGIGINCCQDVCDFPADLRDMAASLKTVTGKQHQIPMLAAAVITELYQLSLDILTKKDTIMAQYRKDCITLGQDVVILRGEKKQYGKAVDIDGDGCLTVQLREGSFVQVSSGEVSVRGMYGYV